MFKSNWTIAWRTLVRNKIYTFVNVAGLTLGICACLVIWVIVHYEFSFDRDHPDGNRIYRINSCIQFMKGEQEMLMTAAPTGLPEAVRSEIPGVEVVAPYYVMSKWTATVAGADKRKTDFSAMPFITGPEYFRIMHYDWLAGDARTALAGPFGVVLTEKRARLLFGPGPLDAIIGKEVVYNDSLHVNVTGIVRDWTEHTDFPSTEFISYSTIDHSWLRPLLSPDNHKRIALTPVLLKLGPRANAARVRADITALFSRRFKGRILPRIGIQPLSEVHFTVAAGDPDTISTTQLSTLYALLCIAVFILSLAIVNYVNLSTAQSLTREKEISIRKVMGSGRLNLIFQLLTETFLLTALAGLIAVFAVRPVLGAFRQFVPETIQFDPFAPANLLFLLGITVTTTLLAGLYPARMLSAHSPVSALKGMGGPRGGGKWWLRKGLIVFQFTVSLLFIIGSLVIGRQIGFMLHESLGFRSDAIVRFDTGERSDSVNKVKVLQEEIRQLPGVADVARENIPPMGPDRAMTAIQYPITSDDKISVEFVKADEHYLPLYGIRLLAGRNLFPSDTLKEAVINETLSRQMGFRSPEEAIGKMIFTWDKNVPIVGVVADFHEFSYREVIQPMLIVGMASTDVAVRLDTRGKSAAEARTIIGRIERQWNGVYPHKPFDFSFFDEWIAQLYQREQTMEWLMNIATGITIFISLIGLFGLTLFTTERRTREIGIRKVMGARVTDILTLLEKDFVRLVLIALVIASAGGWWLMHRWLRDYAYRVRLGPGVFLLAGGALLVVTVLTVGIQSLRAALVNPVKSLRTE
jgi:putative ABC transport system permease protein